jgi:hypothetical protein
MNFTVELGYNVMKRSWYIVSLQTGVDITEKAHPNIILIFLSVI